MTIVFLNKGRLPAGLRSKTALLSKAVNAALKPHTVKGEVTVVFMNDAEIRALNKESLGHDYVTDVIAFNYEEETRSARSSFPSPHGRGPGAARGEGLPFGDITICVTQAKRQADEIGHSHLKELVTLAAHGALHLVGYRDHTPTAKKKMFRLQDAIVASLLKR